MSKKHYVAIAKAFAIHIGQYHRDDPRVAALHLVARNLAFDFRRDNSAFDTERFLTACGVA